MLKSKKILIKILLILLVLIVPNSVNAADPIAATETTKTSTGREVKWAYELSGEEIIHLRTTNPGYLTGELVIPDTIDGHKVTSLSESAYNRDPAFKGASGLTKVTIPDTVITIGKSAFQSCSGLTSVVIPNSVTTIGEKAFEQCTGLKTITIPDSVTSIGTDAFHGCTGLKTINLSKNLSMLSNSVFAYCSGIAEIVLPENLTTIGNSNYSWNSPFYKCGGLKFIKIPENVVSIAEEAFEDCKNLTIYAKEGSVAHTYAKNNEIAFKKIEEWDKRNQTEGADVTAPTVESMKIKYASVMDYYNKTTNDYRLPKGAEFTIIVAFSETLTGNTTPTLTIKCGTGSDIKLNNGVLSGENIVYTYKVTSADKGMISVISLAGGDITDAAKNAAKLSVKELKVQYDGKYAFAEGNNGTTVKEDEKEDKLDLELSLPGTIYPNVENKITTNYKGKYKLYYQTLKITKQQYDEIYNYLRSDEFTKKAQEEMKNGKTVYEIILKGLEDKKYKYNDSNWKETTGKVQYDFENGENYFILWAKLVLTDKNNETYYGVDFYSSELKSSKTLQSIEITSAPTKTTYTVGEKFNSAGMKILATYSDGSKSYVTGDCTYSPSGKLTKNDTTITISYTENGVTKTAKQSIKIDTTIADGNIPYTGGTTIIIASVLAIMAVGAYIYKRNKDFKGI